MAENYPQDPATCQHLHGHVVITNGVYRSICDDCGHTLID